MIRERTERWCAFDATLRIEKEGEERKIPVVGVYDSGNEGKVTVYTAFPLFGVEGENLFDKSLVLKLGRLEVAMGWLGARVHLLRRNETGNYTREATGVVWVPNPPSSR